VFNTEKITDILTLRYHPTKSTLIPPLTINDFLPNSTFNLTNTEYNINMIDKILKTTIKKTIKTDTISLALSGGIDSSIILTKIREVFPNLNIHCITIGFYENDIDFIAAKKISKVFDCEFHGKIVKNPLETLPNQISISHEPRWNTFWTYVVEESKKYSNMLVSGDGGDEIFAGYVFRYKKFIESLNQNDNWIDRVKKYLECHNRDWVPDQQNVFTNKMNFNWQTIYNKLKPSFNNLLHPINQILLADYNGKLLHDWVPINNLIHNHYNITGYSPLINTDLVKLATGVPYNQYTNEGKIPLKQLLERSVCAEYIIKEKKGYAPDLIRLWKNYGKNICVRYLTNSDVVKYKIINEPWINNAIILADNNDFRYISKLFSILSLEIWYRLYITHTIIPESKL
jgi:asparagine synthase (glutamine-hydrolysing)